MFQLFSRGANLSNDAAVALQDLVQAVIKEAHPVEIPLVEPNVKRFLGTGRFPSTENRESLLGFGGAEAITIILPTILTALGIFASATLEKIGEEWGDEIVSWLKKKPDDTPRPLDADSLHQVAKAIESALVERGSDGLSAKATADVFVSVVVAKQDVLRRLRSL